MRRASSLHSFPLAFPFVVAAFVLIALAFASIQIGVLEYAYEKMGVNRHYVLSLPVLSLLGSYVNMPAAEQSQPQ